MPFKNRCIAIINFWDSGEILPFAVRQWFKCGVDVIIIYSNVSNYWEVTDNTDLLSKSEYKDCKLVQCEPLVALSPADNERRKRNHGLKIAHNLGYTHFITCDADELYEQFEIDWDLAGTVVGCQTYFAKPDLTIGLDTTLIPFVHKLTPRIAHEFNRNYPYAFTPQIRIDPTRQLNISSGVVFNDKIICHHYSWLRRDYESKIKNSTARRNLERSTILTDLVQAKEGYFCQFYQKTLRRSEVSFGITI